MGAQPRWVEAPRLQIHDTKQAWLEESGRWAVGARTGYPGNTSCNLRGRIILRYRPGNIRYTIENSDRMDIIKHSDVVYCT